MNHTNYKINDGFTLIEMLIVIAFIGILSSVVLTSISAVRTKAANENAKQGLATAIVRAKLYYFANGESFDGVCSATTTGKKPIGSILIEAAKSVGVGDMATINGDNTAGVWNNITCHDSGKYWVTEVPLRGSEPGKPKMFCVDSIGVQIEKNTTLSQGQTKC